MAALALLGGLLGAVELVVRSLRESQLRSLAARGERGARAARLAAAPERHLPALQVGSVLAGFLAAAYSAVSLSGHLERALLRAGLDRGPAAALAVIGVTLATAYVVVLLELTLRRVAGARPEAVAYALGPAASRLALAGRPLAALVLRPAALLARLLAGDRPEEDGIGEEQIRDLVAGAEAIGGEERRLIGEVLGAGARRLHEVMVPRTEVEFLDAALPVLRAVRLVSDKPHSRYPVVRGSTDDVVGFVHVRDLFGPAAGSGARLDELARPVLRLPGSKQLLPTLSEMRRAGHHLAIVVDEYGGTDGIVTLEDLVEELVGDIRDEYDVETGEAGDGPAQVDGLLNRDDFAERTGIELPEGPYETAGGYVMTALGRIPRIGDSVEAGGHRLLVREMDGRRVSRIEVRPAEQPVRFASISG
nr:hemolysin family protein [Motilibacter aurantiacus]